MNGWVGPVGWPVADGVPTLVVTHQLQVERRTGKVRQSETDVLHVPLCHTTNWLVPKVCYGKWETHMSYGITQCYLPPGRGDIAAFTTAEAGTRFSDPGRMRGWVGLEEEKQSAELSRDRAQLRLDKWQTVVYGVTRESELRNRI